MVFQVKVKGHKGLREVAHRVFLSDMRGKNDVYYYYYTKRKKKHQHKDSSSEFSPLLGFVRGGNETMAATAENTHEMYIFTLQVKNYTGDFSAIALLSK